MSLLYLPTELLTDIFGHLWDDHRALSACALACRRLQPVCQKALFFQITWDMAAHRAEPRFDPIPRLYEMPFTESPRLASYVVRLDIKIVCAPYYSPEPFVSLMAWAAALQNLTCLRDLRILGSPRAQISWKRLLDELQILIMKVIREQPLTRVCLTYITDMPTAPFLDSSIRQLSLSSVSWNDAQASETAPVKAPTLQSLNITLQVTKDSLSTIDHLIQHPKRGSPHKNPETVEPGCGDTQMSMDPLQLGRRFTIWFNSDGFIEPDPLPFLLKMIPNAGSYPTSLEFHLILQLVVFMHHPRCSLDGLGAWTQLAQALAPMSCRLTISIWSHYESRIPELVSLFEGQFSEMHAQRRLLVVNMGFYCS
ncbi:uncharacterized protein LACBIDRAFT_335975 [Laccaria bicolor S238N-H82]|uniref:Predicted protein n=1 Tax=Laccaria bicolor (strain S238N-H82 / ATCC MYA-4686) TaxID=486041 RepID=B0E408_LACBS|nr:uncharacterized protein LACBIDRAFT_335975 [Laccaria bicolor S238N-H82]EDQ98422.1 predicted protein [Laccaria bicolor S238N-H82]|eukprot:XP_001890925.1 predicted protein [Laccaria bicolor S238N-H82]